MLTLPMEVWSTRWHQPIAVLRRGTANGRASERVHRCPCNTRQPLRHPDVITKPGESKTNTPLLEDLLPQRLLVAAGNAQSEMNEAQPAVTMNDIDSALSALMAYCVRINKYIHVHSCASVLKNIPKSPGGNEV